MKVPFNLFNIFFFELQNSVFTGTKKSQSLVLEYKKFQREGKGGKFNQISHDLFKHNP